MGIPSPLGVENEERQAVQASEQMDPWNQCMEAATTLVPDLQSPDLYQSQECPVAEVHGVDTFIPVHCLATP